jgi:hypothetical protein
MKISKELLQALINYLATKPYNEVHGLLSEIAKVLKEETKDEK